MSFHWSAALLSERAASMLRYDLQHRINLAAYERNLLLYIDRILVINLNSRRGLKLQISKELQRHVLGTFKVERVEGRLVKRRRWAFLPASEIS